MNYLIYPLKTMSITQSYYDAFSHLKHTKGNLKDYPIDDQAGENEAAYLYCPCKEMIVKKIYGVGKSASNTIWLESTSPVITPTFTDYVTIMIVHPEDKELINIKVGKKYHLGDKMFKKGADGYATGPHFHITVGRGKFKGSGWKKNNLGLWILTTTKENIKPEFAFFLDTTFTKVSNTKNLNFIYLNTKENNVRYLTANLNVRTGPGLNYKVINTLPKNTKVRILEESGDWLKISNKEYINKKYVTSKARNKAYLTQKVIASNLNVRSKPNGTKVGLLPKETTVAIMKRSGNWTKIYPNKYVATKYLK